MAIALNPTYPAPDRSKQTVHRSKGEDGVVDIGWCDGVMSDGRAFRVEMWAQDGISMLTIFFSQVGIADLAPEQIKALVVAEGLVTFKLGARESFDIRPFADDSGAEMWSVNVVVGDEDNSFLAGSTPLWPCSREGAPATMFNPSRSPRRPIHNDLTRAG